MPTATQSLRINISWRRMRWLSTSNFKLFALLFVLFLTLRYIRRHSNVLLRMSITTAEEEKKESFDKTAKLPSDPIAEPVANIDEDLLIANRQREAVKLWKRKVTRFAISQSKVHEEKDTSKSQTKTPRKTLNTPTVATRGPTSKPHQLSNSPENTSKSMTQPLQITTKQTLKEHPINDSEDQRKVILLYTTLFSQEIWPGLSDTESRQLLQRCDVGNCRITYNKTELHTADAVVFHGVDLLHEKQNVSDALRVLHSVRPAQQRWVFFIQESPIFYSGFGLFNGLFNWTMTYRSDSDIFVPYSHYKPLEAWDKVPSKDLNYAEGKTGFAVWAVSNCGRFRDRYVKNLQKYLNVTVFGKCANEFVTNATTCQTGSENCTRYIKTFKFYFAFENCMCKDYVTEKYWHTSIELGLVPIVLGANYDTKVVIPGSYIDASQFPSVQSLAKHLLYLDKNDTAYSEYFQWKRKYKKIGYDKTCELCKLLHDKNSPSKTYDDIGQYWSEESSCNTLKGVEEKLSTQLEVL